MKYLEEKIMKEGRVISGNVLKVDGFLNHRIDIDLMRQIACDFRRRFEGCRITKLLTIESSGIAIASILASLLDVSVVFAKKGETMNSTDDKYISQAYSFTHKKLNDANVSLCDHDYMQMAIEEAREGITKGHGGPFGTVIVKDGKVVACGHNMVLKNNDPTAHGEITAIRKAGEALGTFDLSGCTLYTTGEPCHMCLCAIMWANIDKVYYGCTIADNGRIGFRDDKFNDIFGGRDRLGSFLTEIDRDKCLLLFDEYNNMQHQGY